MVSDMIRLIATMVFFFTATICCGQSIAPNATVIANEIGMEDMTLSQLRKAMRGELSQWPSKHPVIVVMHSTSLDECALTASFVVNSPRPAVLQTYWLGLVFGGRATPPMFVGSQKDMIETIHKTPGAVGLVYGDTPPSDWDVTILN